MVITPTPETTGLIYVMRAGQRDKIGWCAGNVEKRRAELQTGCPETLEVLVLFPGTRTEEAACHRRFAQVRCEGGGQEWFRLSEDLEQFIAEQQQAHADLHLSLENDARYRALWNYYARWSWDPLDKKGKRPGGIPESLSANDIHRAILSADWRPERLSKMIRALEDGETSVPPSDRAEWPAIVLRGYLAQIYLNGFMERQSDTYLAVVNDLPANRKEPLRLSTSPSTWTRVAWSNSMSPSKVPSLKGRRSAEPDGLDRHVRLHVGHGIAVDEAGDIITAGNTLRGLTEYIKRVGTN